MGTAPPPTGNLTEFSPVRLYSLVASGEHTALLSFHLADRVIEVRFRKGNPEHVSSSHPEDSVAEFLKVHALLDDAQLQRAESVRGDFGNDLVSALFGLGLLTPVSAFANLAEHALSVMLKAIVAQSGTFAYQDSLLNPVKVMPLGNRWAVLVALLRRIPLADIKLRLVEHLDRPLTKVDGRVPLKELPLTPQETRALTYLNGSDSLSELARKFPQDSENLHRLAFLLRDLDLVTTAPGSAVSKPASGPSPREAPSRSSDPAPPVLTPSRGIAGVGKPLSVDGAPRTPPRSTPSKGVAPHLTPSRGVAAPAPQPAPYLTPSRGVAAPTPQPAPYLTPSRGVAAPAPQPAPYLTPSKGMAAPARFTPSQGVVPHGAAATLPLDAELENLRALAVRLKDDNYFQVLGIEPKANAAAVKNAYIKLAKLYHPDSVPSNGSAEVAKLKEEIFAIIGQAYRVLSDDLSRANYAEILEGGESDQEMLPLSQVLLSEEKFERGRNLVRAKRFAEAVEVLDEAIGGSGDVAEFWAWRGYAKFFAISDKKKAQAEANRDLQAALTKSQHCASAHYFLGHIAKLMGDTKTALVQFKKAVELKPDHIDAKREVRLLTKK